MVRRALAHPHPVGGTAFFDDGSRVGRFSPLAVGGCVVVALGELVARVEFDPPDKVCFVEGVNMHCLYHVHKQSSFLFLIITQILS